MRKSRFTVEQITLALRQAEAGMSVGEICRKLQVTETTFYRWKKKYGGLGVPELRELRQLREENRKLKQLVADLSLDKTILQESLKKILRPAVKQEWTNWVQHAYQLTQRRACRVTGVARSLVTYRHRRPKQEPLRRHIRQLAGVRISYGYRRLHILLLREGWRINHKRVYRLYREEGLALRRKRPKRRRSAVARQGRPKVRRPNERCAMDFMHDTLATGEKIRVLTVVDVFTRECLALEVRRSFRGPDVTEVLGQLGTIQGLPQTIQCDQGTEFTSNRNGPPGLEPADPDRLQQTGHTGRQCHQLATLLFESRGSAASTQTVEGGLQQRSSAW